ncbi:MAG TPA: hypothetical protein PLN21_17400 [Gemmatales bacterium]|nr:hypothetical protein [Gemmatales bacterium]
MSTITMLLFAPLLKPWPKVLEGTLYLQCFLLLAHYPPVQQLFASIPKSQHRVVLCLGGILLVTQLLSRPQQTFPFIAWNMYSGRFAEPTQYLEYIGVGPDNQEMVIPIGKLFAAQHRTMFWHLNHLLKKVEAEPNQLIRKKYADQHQALLDVYMARFNELYPEKAVSRVRVIECTLSRPAPGVKLEVTRRLIGEYPLS